MLVSGAFGQLKFSIVTITYNSERYLEETIKSVLEQDETDFEYLVIDGGSTDSTLLLVEQYAANDPRIRWISESDRGISDAMNKGIRMARGTVVAHLHSDDYYLPGTLRAVWSGFQKQPDAEWLVGRCRVVDGEGALLYEPPIPQELTFKQLLSRNLVPHPATFIKRSCFEEVGEFSENFRYAMDYDLFLRLSARQSPLLLDRAVTAFRYHTGSLSSSSELAAYREEYQIRMAYIANMGFVARMSSWISFLMQTTIMRLGLHNIRKRLLAKL